MKLTLFAVSVLALGLLSGSELTAHSQPGCTVTVQPSGSIQKAINEAPAGAVICLEQGTWHESVFIYKELTIVGVGPEKTIIDGSVWVYQPAAQVTLQGVQISDLWIIGPGSLSLVSSSIAARGFGLVIYGQVTVNIVNSQIAGASLGGIAVLSEGVQLSLINSRVVRNWVGISIGLAQQKSHLSLVDSIISDNGWRGLIIGGSTQAEIMRSTIENNGTNKQTCTVSICPGIEVIDQSKTTIVESKILNNADWGLAAHLKKCGYTEDRFTGKVIIDEKTVIEGNNKAGKHQGEVCLP